MSAKKGQNRGEGRGVACPLCGHAVHKSATLMQRNSILPKVSFFSVANADIDVRNATIYRELAI